MPIEITVLGAGREVGRAAIHVKNLKDESAVLLDYGVSFDEEDRPLFPLAVSPSKLKAVLVTHAHLDHVGAVPFLYISARPLLIMSRLTAKLSKLMIEDMIKISGYFLPYEYPELIAMLENVKPIEIGETLEIDNIRIESINAGHIPGSIMFKITMGEKSILYTGDINTIDTRLIKGLKPQNIDADILIIESTYGLYDHPERSRVEELFIDTVKSVIEDGGNVLVPAFSLGRAQEILTLLIERLPNANVYYDGMAKEILNILLEHREYINRYDLLLKVYERFIAVDKTTLRKKICKEGGNIIVAPAGMLKGGPALYYIRRLGDNPRNAIILVSYQAPSTPGRKLLTNGVIEEGGSRIRAKLYWFDFSSHAGSTGLFNVVKSIKNVEKVLLVHGNDDSIYTLGYRIKDELGIEFEAPANGQTILIK
ncbi:beta-lactamase domain protein [Ignisphaera aggregans DSM 17230]|uniref:Beta-lactamase domain protein n=1 Tax=Ignisphaera aggregans (strain DSM 17230 / JCM 13409 / AQ1.S1) TaxID=583356 RepID=E0SR17_IGNAA|nr:beta-lactamase domain protein [Ignisphaera aggregans DSM 17230]